MHDQQFPYAVWGRAAGVLKAQAHPQAGSVHGFVGRGLGNLRVSFPARTASNFLFRFNLLRGCLGRIPKWLPD